MRILGTILFCIIVFHVHTQESMPQEYSESPAITIDFTKKEYGEFALPQGVAIPQQMAVEAWIKPSHQNYSQVLFSQPDAQGGALQFGINKQNYLFLSSIQNGKEHTVISPQQVKPQEWSSVGFSIGTSAFTQEKQIITSAQPNRAWQGVATDGIYIYTLTDRNEYFEHENIISKYTMDGQFVFEKRQAYNPSADCFFAFGDGSIIDGKLYVGTYNFNDEKPECKNNLKSRIAIFNTQTFEMEKDISINSEIAVAEGIEKHNDSLWVVEGDENTLKVAQYDMNFHLQKVHMLDAPLAPEDVPQLTYQTIDWRGEDLFVNWHGSNVAGEEYAFGLDRYTLIDGSLHYMERLAPITYGAGQSIDIVGNTFYWNDRVTNTIWSSEYVGTNRGDDNSVAVNFIVNGEVRAGGVLDSYFAEENTFPLTIGSDVTHTSPYTGKMSVLHLYTRPLSTKEIVNQYYSFLHGSLTAE